jgi:Ca2+-binding EF-hand superfamily protein
LTVEYDQVKSNTPWTAEEQTELTNGIAALKRMIEMKTASGETLGSLARKSDAQRNGYLSRQDFQRFLEQYKEAQLSPLQCQLLTRLADKNEDGNIRYEEFFDFIKMDLKARRPNVASQEDEF